MDLIVRTSTKPYTAEAFFTFDDEENLKKFLRLSEQVAKPTPVHLSFWTDPHRFELRIIEEEPEPKIITIREKQKNG
jgi:hypothetical protein